MGYSVKARGIARDLFGSEQDYVLPVQTLQTPDQLTIAFQKLWDKKGCIRSHLKQYIPVYTASGYSAVQSLKDI